MTDLELYYIYKTEKGLRRRGLADKPEYVERLKYENEVIVRMGYPGYFLIVQDFIQWAHKNNIYVGPGRGSGVGSLACYCLGITQLDPIKFNLLFERFLSEDRISMPDLDIDFEKRYRDLVINYVVEKFGKERVAHIGTFGVLRAKGAIRAVARVLGHPKAIGDELSKLHLPPIAGKAQPLSLAIQKVPEFHKIMKQKGSTEEEVLSWALKLEGTIFNAGVHASGIVISNNPLIETTPLFISRDGEITTQLEMNNVEEVGLIKFDFLGLKALEIIHRCVDLVKKTTGQTIDVNNIPIDDDNVFAMLRAGENMNTFQIEGSSGIKELLVQIKPSNIEDIINVIAIYRPGPIASSYKDIYLAVRAGLREPEYLIPELEPILKPTAGWLIFQEQVMEIAKKLCGYTGPEADEVRRAVGKKKKSLMLKHEDKFKQGWIDNGYPEEAVRQLWDDIVAFASYSFNRAHAAAYAMITYQTAYLKCYHPTEFMCAVMIAEANSKDDIIKDIAECRRLGIKVLPPHINESRGSFSVPTKHSIRFGLNPVKNLGESPVQTLIKDREANGPFKGLVDFCDRVDLGIINRLKLESLIKAGAFDGFGLNRNSMLGGVELLWEYRKQLKSYRNRLETYYKRMDDYDQRLIDVEEGKCSETGKKLRPLKKPELPIEPAKPMIPEIEELETAEVQRFEHELLGFYVSSHPLDNIKKTRAGHSLNSIEDAKDFYPKTQVTLGIVISEKDEITTKRKSKMAFVTMEDLTGSIAGVCFPKTYAQYGHLLDETRPLKVYGTVEVTETDEDRITKIIIYKIEQLNTEAQSKPEKIDLNIDLMRAGDLLKALDRYSGSLHEVRITLESRDGTRFFLPPTKIGDYKGTFMRELSRIINDQTSNL